MDVMLMAEDGRDVQSYLERIQSYHREHGNLGIRYIQVIQLFNPSFTYDSLEDWQRREEERVMAR